MESGIADAKGNFDAAFDYTNQLNKCSVNVLKQIKSMHTTIVNGVEQVDAFGSEAGDRLVKLQEMESTWKANAAAMKRYDHGFEYTEKHITNGNRTVAQLEEFIRGRSLVLNIDAVTWDRVLFGYNLGMRKKHHTAARGRMCMLLSTNKQSVHRAQTTCWCF